MSRETQSLFKAMFALEDIREILRKTAPTHELGEEEIKKGKKAIKKVKEAIEVLEEWINAGKPTSER